MARMEGEKRVKDTLERRAEGRRGRETQEQKQSLTLLVEWVSEEQSSSILVTCFGCLDNLCCV